MKIKKCICGSEYAVNRYPEGHCLSGIIDEENKTLRAKVEMYEGALRYVARHNNTPKQMALNILDECVTVCAQALAKGKALDEPTK